MSVYKTTTVVLCGQDFTVSTGICIYSAITDKLPLPLEISVFQPGEIFPLKKHLTISRDIFGCNNFREFPLAFIK
jgi:hypothetical protein